MMARVGTNTNSNDPQSLRSRVFVGNIDPSMSREEIESIFHRYGSVSALSVHKGFAFVQYNDELSARAAVFGENNKKYRSKYLDCNVASEPKPNRKRAHNYNSISSESCANPQIHPYLAATAQALAVQNPPPPPPPVPQLMSWPDYGGSSAKFSRVGTGDFGGTRSSNLVSLVAQSSPAKPRPQIQPLLTPVSQLESEGSAEKASTKDILICGSCKGLFDNYDTLINHKAQGCRLRFICRCKQMGEPKSLTCNRCFQIQRSSWELVLHHINVHGASLFVDEERYSQPVTPAVDETKGKGRNEVIKRERPQLANGQVAVEPNLRRGAVKIETEQSPVTAAPEVDDVDHTIHTNTCDSDVPVFGDGESVDLNTDDVSVLRKPPDEVMDEGEGPSPGSKTDSPRNHNLNEESNSPENNHVSASNEGTKSDQEHDQETSQKDLSEQENDGVEMEDDKDFAKNVEDSNENDVD